MRWWRGLTPARTDRLEISWSLTNWIVLLTPESLIIYVR
jgi:hypothetical protein